MFDQADTVPGVEPCMPRPPRQDGIAAGATDTRHGDARCPTLPQSGRHAVQIRPALACMTCRLLVRPLTRIGTNIPHCSGCYRPGLLPGPEWGARRG